MMIIDNSVALVELAEGCSITDAVSRLRTMQMEDGSYLDARCADVQCGVPVTYCGRSNTRDDLTVPLQRCYEHLHIQRCVLAHES
jgi:hypothetical protein